MSVVCLEKPVFVPEPKPRCFIPYDIPLTFGRLGRDNWARLVLPADMTQAEAERLCGVIRTLAMPS